MATTITGRDLLRARLAALPKAVQASLQADMEKSANEVADLARSRAPVGNGTLRASIRVEPFNKGGIGAIIRAGGPTTTKPVKNGKSPSYDYALGQELGTQEMLAHPFFYPSYRQLKSKIKRNAAKAVKAAVEGNP